jgi:HAD superfamily hydrolase (TIGR01509 family)
MKYRAILFDFDGTLVPSLPLWLSAFHEALGHYGIVVSDDDVVRRCFYRAWNDVAVDFGIYPVESFSLHVEMGLRRAFLEAELYPFARRLLVHCRNHGLLTALVTSSPRSVLTEAILRLDLGNLFDFVISGDDVQNHKPHPEPLLTALSALGHTASEAIMIGDSQADMLAGKAAGTATALFLPHDHTRYNYIDVLRTTDPDLVFSEHTALPQLLGLPAMRRADYPEQDP